MYNLLKDFRSKNDLDSPNFRTELYNSIKELLIKSFADEKTYFNDNTTHMKIEALTSFFLEIYKMGHSIAQGKTFADYEKDYVENVIAMKNILDLEFPTSLK